MPSITDFKSSVSFGGGLALQNRYRVQFGFPDGIIPAGNADAARRFDFLCDSATIPARIISTFDYQAQKQSYKIANGFSFEEVSFTFLLTNDYFVKRVFDEWASAIIDFANYRAKYRTDYAADIDIIQMGKNDNPVYGCKLIAAYPTNVSAITLENSAENSVQRLTVSMAYENFEMIEDLNYNITAN